MIREKIVENLTFTECPRWHNGKLWFSDFYTKSVYSVTPDGKCQVELTLDDLPAGLGWMPDGELRIVSQAQKKLLGFNGLSVYEVADLSLYASGNCNDMVIDRTGNAFIGNFGFDFHSTDFEPKSANLIKVSHDGLISLASENMLFPNGSVITKDNKGSDILIVAESMGFCLTAFNIDMDGNLFNRRIYADFGRPEEYSIEEFSLKSRPENSITPDGIALDNQGNIWVATIKNELVKVTPEGYISERLTFDNNVIACAVSPDDSIYVCTTSHQNPEDCIKFKSAAIEKIYSPNTYEPFSSQ